MTPDDLITEFSYELRNESGNFSRPELLSYVNRALEMIYVKLVERRGEFARTGTGSFSTIAGIQHYDLISNDMSGVWVLHRVWVSGYEPMNLCEENELYDTINAEEGDETGHRCIPQDYCLLGNVLWFKQSPDAVYTIRVKYFPGFSKILLSDDMPYNGIADISVKDMVLVLANNRIKRDDKLHLALQAYTQHAVDMVMALRETQSKKITVHSGCMQCH